MENKVEDFKRLYSNVMGLKVTSVDFCMEVKYRNGEDTEHMCDVLMTPEQAKVTRDMLNEAIEKYESTFRTIKLKENIITETKGEQTNGGEE